MKHWIIAVLLLAGGAPPLWAAEQAFPPGFDPQRHIPLSEVHDGMKGYGLTVFHGTKIERFDVEVISVLHNFNPKHDVIWVRCKGPTLEHTGAIAGMSGSPIYLIDSQGRARMAGAFAYGFPLAKDPVGGVQPIEYMLEMAATARPRTPTTRVADVESQASAAPATHWSLYDTIPAPWKKHDARDLFAPAKRSMKAFGLLGDADQGDRVEPLATPMMVSGMPQSVLQEFEPALLSCGIMPLQAGGGAVALDRAGLPAKLEPGSAIAVPMMSGDADMTAVGTVTEVVGKQVLAFGHPFFSEGEVALPMGSGYIHTVVATLNKSFKVGSATAVQGTLNCDQMVGIAGNLGPAPATIPVEIRCTYADGSFDQTYRFNIAQHPKFTPMLASVAAATATTSSRELPQYHTLDYDLNLEFAGGQTLRVQNRSVNNSAQDLVMAIGQPIMAAMENPFHRVPLRKLTGTVRVTAAARQADILSVNVPKTRFRAGETVKAFVTYRPFRGSEAILPIEFELPRDLPDGAYDFAVMDWQQHLAEEQNSRPFRFTAENTRDVFAVLRDFMSVRHDALYVRLLRQPDGVAIGRVAMPRLPSSRRRVLMGAGLSNTTTFVSSTVKIVATDYVMNGQAHFSVSIDKGTKVDTATRPPLPGSKVERVEDLRPAVTNTAAGAED